MIKEILTSTPFIISISTAFVIALFKTVSDFILKMKDGNLQKDKFEHEKKLEILKNNTKDYLDRKKLIWDKKYIIYQEVYNDFIELYAISYDLRTLVRFGDGLLSYKEKKEMLESITKSIELIKKLMKHGPFVDNIFFKSIEPEFLKIKNYIVRTRLHYNWLENGKLTQKEWKEYSDEIEPFKQRLGKLRDDFSDFIFSDLDIKTNQQ